MNKEENDDLLELDLEPGAFIVPPVNNHLAAFLTYGTIALLLVSIGSEYYQQKLSIRGLKESTPMSDSCREHKDLAMNAVQRFLYRISGLENSDSRRCWEQQRVHDLNPEPNLLIVVVNTFWRAFIGDHAAHEISHLLSMQSYAFQAALIFSSVAAAALIVYQIILKLPGVVVWGLQFRDVKRRDAYVENRERLSMLAVRQQSAARAVKKLLSTS